MAVVNGGAVSEGRWKGLIGLFNFNLGDMFGPLRNAVGCCNDNSAVEEGDDFMFFALEVRAPMPDSNPHDSSSSTVSYHSFML